MTTFINGTDIVFTNNSSNNVITLKPSSGKTLSIEGLNNLAITSATFTDLKVTNSSDLNKVSIVNGTVTDLNVTKTSSLNNAGSYSSIDTSTTGSIATYNPAVSATGGQGSTVSIDRDTIAIGNFNDQNNNVPDNFIGSVSVYRYTSGSWSLESLIKPTIATCNYLLYGNTKVYNNRLLVAGTQYSTDTGASIVYSRSGSTWSQEQDLGKPLIDCLDMSDTTICGQYGFSSYMYTRSSNVWTKKLDANIGTNSLSCACNDTYACFANNTGNGTIRVYDTTGTLVYTLTGSSNAKIGSFIYMSSEYLVSVSSSYVVIYSLTDFSISSVINISGASLTKVTLNSKDTGANTIIARSASKQYFITLLNGRWILQDPSNSTTTLSYASINSIGAYGQTLVMGNYAFSSNRGIFYINTWTTTASSSTANSVLTLNGLGLNCSSSLPIVIGSTIPSVSTNVGALVAPNGGLSSDSMYTNTLVYNSATGTNLNITNLNTTNLNLTNTTSTNIRSTNITTTNLNSTGITTNSLSCTNLFSSNLVGLICAFALSSVPTGFLYCDGSAVSRTTYSLLFSKIGTTWGVGNGSTTFNLPDLRGAFLRGTGTGTINTRSKAGPSVGAFQEDAMQTHTHTTTVTSQQGGATSYPPDTRIMSDYLRDTTISNPSYNFTSGNPSGRTASETYPYNAGVYYCIFAGV